MLVETGLPTLSMSLIVLFDVHTGTFHPASLAIRKFGNSTALLVGLLTIDSAALSDSDSISNLSESLAGDMIEDGLAVDKRQFDT